MNTNPTIAAIDRLKVKAIELANRARVMEQLVLAGDTAGLPLGVEMLRVSVSAIEFWFAQLEKAQDK